MLGLCQSGLALGKASGWAHNASRLFVKKLFARPSSFRFWKAAAVMYDDHVVGENTPAKVGPGRG